MQCIFVFGCVVSICSEFVLSVFAVNLQHICMLVSHYFLWEKFFVISVKMVLQIGTKSHSTPFLIILHDELFWYVLDKEHTKISRSNNKYREIICVLMCLANQAHSHRNFCFAFVPNKCKQKPGCISIQTPKLILG